MRIHFTRTNCALCSFVRHDLGSFVPDTAARFWQEPKGTCRFFYAPPFSHMTIEQCSLGELPLPFLGITTLVK